jgi:hypothetical protein
MYLCKNLIKLCLSFVIFIPGCEGMRYEFRDTKHMIYRSLFYVVYVIANSLKVVLVDSSYRQV